MTIEMSSKNRYKIIIVLGLMMLLGLSIRLITCFWGYPVPLHPDEPTIVENAIDIISRHSWEPNVFYRPDHFEIKGCAILFQIISYIKYGMSADLAFESHEMVFYLIARGYTTIFGVLMIPMAYLLAEKCRKGVGLLAAGLTTIFSIFVLHSAYATPDIVLTLFVMLIAYISIKYLENSRTWTLVIICILCGVGITIKYTCAICCIWIAFIIIYDCIKKKDYKRIWKSAVLSIAIVVLACFFMAPNLFTNLPETIAAFKNESRNTHPGLYGLGLFRNFLFYFTTFMTSMGWETFPIILLGIISTLHSKEKNCIVLGLGLLFWICTSILALHWARWGMPIYAFFIIFVSMGICKIFELINQITYKKFKKIGYILAAIWLVIIVSNMAISTISQTIYELKPNAQVAASTYCTLNHITEESTFYESYTPFSMASTHTLDITVNEDGDIVFPDNSENKKYIILSSRAYARYYAEPTRYADKIAAYEAIKKEYKLIASFTNEDYPKKSWATINIIDNIQYFLNYDPDGYGGCTILIYQIK